MDIHTYISSTHLLSSFHAILWSKIQLRLPFLAPSRSPRSHSVCVSVCPSGTSLSKALNLHLSLIGQSQVSLRSASDQSKVSLRSVPGQSQASLRSVSGQSQVSLRSVPGQSQVSPRSVPGQSQVSLRSLWAYFVSKTVPKILCLVHWWLSFTAVK